MNSETRWCYGCGKPCAVQNYLSACCQRHCGREEPDDVPVVNPDELRQAAEFVRDHDSMERWECRATEGFESAAKKLAAAWLAANAPRDSDAWLELQRRSEQYYAKGKELEKKYGETK